MPKRQTPVDVASEAAALEARLGAEGKTLRDHLRECFSLVDAALDAQLDYARAVGARGWTVTQWMPLHWPYHLASGTTAELDAFFLRQYGQERRKLERGLLTAVAGHPDLGPWRLALADAVSAYQRRLYQVVLPTVLPILEGALAVAGGEYHRLFKVAKFTTTQREHAPTAMYRLGWASLQGFTEEVFGNRPFGGAASSVFNRHWVTHGRHVTPCTRVECLRAFNALETTAWLVEGTRKRTSAG
jgi:hypothetical protein